MPGPLNDSEQFAVAYHLGYMTLRAAAGPGFAWPTLVQINYPIYAALQNMIPGTEDRVRTLLGYMDATEQQIFDAQSNLDAAAVSDITLNPQQIAKLKLSYRYWLRRLSQVTGVLPAPVHPLLGGSTDGVFVARN